MYFTGEEGVRWGEYFSQKTDLSSILTSTQAFAIQIKKWGFLKAGGTSSLLSTMKRSARTLVLP